MNLINVEYDHWHQCRFPTNTPEVNAGIWLCSKADEHQGPTPPSLKFHNLSAILLSKPTEGPCFPGQVFITQWCSCHQSGDSVKCHSVRNCRKKDPTSPSLRAQVLKNLDPDTPPKPWECSLLLQEFQVNAILGEKKVNKVKALSWQSTFCVGTL